MAETTVVSAGRVSRWRKQLFTEYIRANQFADYMGKDENKPIQVFTDIEANAGEVVHFPLVTKITGDGVTGNGTMEGNEVPLSNYDDLLTVDWRRQAVLVTKKEENVTEWSIRDAAKLMLKGWGMEQLRDDIIDTLMSPEIGGTRTYAVISALGAAGETIKDAWLAANTDRVRFGASGYVSGDHSAGLTGLDLTNDRLTVANARLMKRNIKAASPAIRPIMIDGKGEWYVVFTPSQAFKDLKDSLDNIHQNAAPRSMKDNPLFNDGDLVVDGMIFKEVPEISIADFVNTGDGGTVETAPVFALGAQAVGIAWGQKPDFKVDMNRDYQFRYGVCYEECLEVKKAYFNNKQHGVFTFYVAVDPS